MLVKCTVLKCTVYVLSLCKHTLLHTHTHTHTTEACVASVVFGVGKDCYTTERVDSNAPEWNQEAKMYTPIKHYRRVLLYEFLFPNMCCA